MRAACLAGVAPTAAREWLRCRRGAVAVETAIVLPLLLMALAVMIDVVDYIRTTARIDRVALSTSDLIARNVTVIDRVDFNNVRYTNELGMFFRVANETALPDHLDRDGRVIVSSIDQTSRGSTVNWQRTGPFGLTRASRVDRLPALPAGAYIVAEVFYLYRPVLLARLGVLREDDLTLYRRAIFRPRRASLRTLEAAPR